MPRDIKPGDTVEVVKPDPDYGIACILAGYDAAYLVERVEGDKLWLETRLPLFDKPVFVTVQECVKSSRQPWWVK